MAVWDDLAKSAIEPNVFYEPWQFIPALSAFGAGQSLIMIVLHNDPGRGDAPIAIGFFPWQWRKRLRGWPVGVLAAWRHPFMMLSTPLLRAGFAHEAWNALMTWTRTSREGASLLDFQYAGSAGPV